MEKSVTDLLIEYKKNNPLATLIVSAGESKPPADIPAPELAAWTVVASIVMNLDESLNL